MSLGFEGKRQKFALEELKIIDNYTSGAFWRSFFLIMKIINVYFLSKKLLYYFRAKLITFNAKELLQQFN